MIPVEADRVKTCPNEVFGFAAHCYEPLMKKPFLSYYGGEAKEADRQLELDPAWQARYQFHRDGIISRYHRKRKAKA